MRVLIKKNHLAVTTVAVSVIVSSLLIPLFLGLVVDLLNHSEKDLLDQITKVAFAANEGLLRCTNGKLVTTQDQCPQTDQCPPPQNTTVANCTLGQSPNSKPSTANQSFAANEGLLRCTNGKLVTTQDQCPQTDQCPPPQNTTVTDCTLGQSPNSKPSTANQQDKPDNQTMTTDCYQNRATMHTPQCPVNATSSVNSTSIDNTPSPDNSLADNNAAE
jgi:hypothetical protein